ncbi:hypothetical protein MTO96_049882 [Rhipicephalus appendiculatus]
MKTAAANAAHKKAGAQHRGALSFVVPPAAAGKRLQDNHLSEECAGARKSSEHRAECGGTLQGNNYDGKSYDVAAYLAPHEDSGQGVAPGIDPRLTIEELTVAFGNLRNPQILGVRKLGNSSSAVIIVENETVPRWIYCYGVPLRCELYKNDTRCATDVAS